MSVFELETDDRIRAFDANFQEETPPIAPDNFSEDGPSRFTIWIPTESVTVNMGEAVNKATVSGKIATEDESAPVQVDLGFVVQTDHHVHFHTFGEPAPVSFMKLEDNETREEKTVATARTVLRLGTPSIAVVKAGEELYGSDEENSLSTPTEIGSSFPMPYELWPGYSMITEGGSYQESWGNNLIVSGNADLRLAGMRSVEIGSPGDVHIMAIGETIADIVDNDYDRSLVETEKRKSLTASGRWVDQQEEWKIFSAVMSVISAGMAVGMQIEQYYHYNQGRPPEEGKPGWKTDFNKPKDSSWTETMANPSELGGGMTGGLGAAAIQGIGDTFMYASSSIGACVAVGLAASAVADLISPTTGMNSSVTVFANKGFSAYGKTSATVHSEVSVSLSSALFSSMSANVSASISSLLATTVSGTITAVNGLATATMTSAYGPATVRGKTSATLASWGKVFVSGNEDAQVNSMDKNAYMHGGAGFYVGCGAGAPTETYTGRVYADGPGYGIQGTPTGLKLGAMKTANVFATPGPDETKQILIEDGKMTLTHGKAAIVFEKDEVFIAKDGKRVCIC